MLNPVRTDTARTPKTRIQARNEARILDAAQSVFAKHGFKGATVDQIAAGAKMSKPNVHYYFKRKTDLYLAVLMRTLDIWLAPLRELNPDGDPAQELRHYISAKLRFSRDNHGVAHLRHGNPARRPGPGTISG